MGKLSPPGGIKYMFFCTISGSTGPSEYSEVIVELIYGDYRQMTDLLHL